MMFSGSKFGLLRHCQWWARPEVECPRADNADTSAGAGKHRVLEALALDRDTIMSYAETWGCAPDEWPAIERNIREWLETGRTELALYYDPETERARLADVRDRMYAPEDGEVPMTIDLLIECEKHVQVMEYKTGRQENLETVAENGQIAICCLAAARATGTGSADGVLVCVRDDGTAEITTAEFDGLDLDAIADEVRSLTRAIPLSVPQPGPWCAEKWCPARAGCPCTMQAIVATPLEPLSLVIADAETCARVHTQIGLAEEFLEAVKRARNDWLTANAEGCDLGDGARLVMAIEERDSIVLNNAAIAAISEAGALEAVEQKTSRAALERVLKRDAPRGEGGPRVKALLAALDACHAIKTSQYSKPKVRKARGK